MSSGSALDWRVASVCLCTQGDGQRSASAFHAPLRGALPPAPNASAAPAIILIMIVAFVHRSESSADSRIECAPDDPSA